MITLSISCGTTATAAKSLPEIIFPAFPVDLSASGTSVLYTDDTETTVLIRKEGKADIHISSELFFSLVEYDIDVQECLEKYTYLRKNFLLVPKE